MLIITHDVTHNNVLQCILFLNFLNVYIIYSRLTLSQPVQIEFSVIKDRLIMSKCVEKVYHKFSVKDKESNEIVNYKVVLLLSKYFDESLDMLLKYYVKDETFCRSKRLCEKKEALEMCSEAWSVALEQHLSIGCFKEGSNKLIAVNVMIIAHFDDEDFCLNQQELVDILEVLTYTSKQFNPFEHYKVSKYLTDYGLLVHPDYRKLGIATEMLKARIPMMKELGIELTASDFTGTGSQIAAMRAGYTETYSIK